MVTHYDVLGVAVGASRADIHRAYLALARRHHPDGHTAAGPAAVARAERRMQDVNAAWAVLGDPAARRKYDAERDGTPDLPPPGATINRASGPGWTPRPNDTAWMDDFDKWKNDDEDFVPPDTPRTPRQQAFTVLPVIVFGAAVIVGFVGLAMDTPALLAVAFIGVMLSVMLLLLLTMVEMRGRDAR